MPFDGVNSPERQGPPKRVGPAEDILLLLIAVLALCLLLLPVSLSGFVDVIRYVQGR